MKKKIDSAGNLVHRCILLCLQWGIFMTCLVLDLSQFKHGSLHLSPAVASNLAEAAEVCLCRKGHVSGVKLHYKLHDARIVWDQVDPRAFASHADEFRATEDGACAVALIAVKALKQLDFIDQTRRGNGFDYWIGRSDLADPFKSSHRLEVSGTCSEDAREISSRMRKKVEQLRRGEANCGTGLPAIAAVVGFARPTLAMEFLP